MQNDALGGIRDTDARLYVERRRVRFQEADAVGILFHARFFDYFHDAYVGFLRERGAPLERALRDGGWMAPLRHAEAEYIRPLRFGAEVEVVIAVLEVEATEYTIGYRVESDGEVACVGRTRHVSVDPASFRRAPVPDVLRQALEQPASG